MLMLMMEPTRAWWRHGDYQLTHAEDFAFVVIPVLSCIRNVLECIYIRFRFTGLSEWSVE